MEKSDLTLLIEINNYNLNFLVVRKEQNNFTTIHNIDVIIDGFNNNSFTNFDKACASIKENIYLLEKKLNFTFQEAILILEKFNPTYVNVSGYKRLNGSQISRENITYILNTLKSYVDLIETKKTIIHIFNTNFYLDNKRIENLPIWLFGFFYYNELYFSLIKNNDYKNLKNIFDTCSLKIKKILLKSFVKGAYISNIKKNTETFFQIRIGENNTKIFFFENNSLKFEQDFKFGTNIIIKDISKITSLKTEIVKKILDKIEFEKENFNNEIIDPQFFEDDINRKIKKKLIRDIIEARIQEIFEIIILKNVNLKYYDKIVKAIFLEITDHSNLKCLKEIFRTVFTNNNKIDVNFIDSLPNETMLNTIQELVHFGWKKEAIPISYPKKSLVTRFFDILFG
mgnify:FL=1